MSKMLKTVIYSTLAVIALAGTSSCAGLEKTLAEEPPHQQTAESAKEAIEKESFFNDKNVLEERTGELSVSYTYKNGIKATVTYKKSEGLSDIYIKITADPNNVLVKGTVVPETPENCSYQMLTRDDKIKKAISFRISKDKTVSVVLINGVLEYVRMNEYSKGKNKSSDYEVPELLRLMGEAHLRRIEECLDLSAHQRILKAQPISKKTETF